MQKDEARQWLLDALDGIYHDLSCGLDISPGRCLRLEGQIDLLLAWQLLERNWLISEIENRYRQCCGEAVEAGFWQWQQQGVFVLPLRMREAPVYKSGT